MSVFFHYCTAAGSVDGDELRTRLLERRNITTRQNPRSAEITRMRVERTATALAGSLGNRVAIDTKDSLGGAVRRAEQAFHHAAAEWRHATALATRLRPVPRTLY